MVGSTIFLIVAGIFLLATFYDPFVNTVYKVRQSFERVVNLRHFKKNKFKPWFRKFAAFIFIIALVYFCFSVKDLLLR
jgi:hypothetical protein